MLMELIQSAMHSTTQGFIGVGIIFAYLLVMLCAIAYRIKKADHMEH